MPHNPEGKVTIWFLHRGEAGGRKGDSSSVPEGKLMGVELIGVYKSGSINWG